jgi:hypothetical protein
MSCIKTWHNFLGHGDNDVCADVFSFGVTTLQPCFSTSYNVHKEICICFSTIKKMRDYRKVVILLLFCQQARNELHQRLLYPVPKYFS